MIQDLNLGFTNPEFCFFLYLEILCLRFTQFLSHRDHMNQRNNLGHSILVYLCIQVLFDKIKQK